MVPMPAPALPKVAIPVRAFGPSYEPVGVTQWLITSTTRTGGPHGDGTRP